ncbi:MULTISPECIES: GLPGLI family protein [Psychroflexus]|uniref:GLPGLI family protein n=2 Tax=Psychroflexus TaxID=83612 RepID=A0A916ZUB9_9FLAO|nr:MULTISPECIES: GLPGLI family protein [Psychroflexus]GGE14564.1 GLPGLI family protein [Psychroflexus salis]GGE44597.1 GLPGLI family protein [Psychroflexus planctonicus]
MIKIKFISAIFFVTSIIFSQPNSGEITYGQNVIKMVIDTTSINDSYVKKILVEQYYEKQKALKADDPYYSLQFNGEKYVFKRLNFMDNDAYGKITNQLAKGTYFINTQKNSIYHKGNFMGEDLIIYYNKQPYKWEIKNEHKIIRGYNCIKAETIKRNEKGVETKVTAWFTTEINLNFGPKNYFGLPGLIIELYELDSVYYLKDIKFKSIKLNEINSKDKKIITYDKYISKVNGNIRF